MFLKEKIDKKWVIKHQEVLPDPACDNCHALQNLIKELYKELEEERKSASETIAMVEDLERKHSSEMQKLQFNLRVEKDKVDNLADSLDKERRLRMEDLYKHDRELKENDKYKEYYATSQQENHQLSEEVFSLRKENAQFKLLLSQLQTNKNDTMAELVRYEQQIAEYEVANTDLRKRTYAAETEVDRLLSLVDKLKHRIKNLEFASPTSKRPGRNSLSPINREQTSFFPENSRDESTSLGLSKSSRSRVSSLSSINIIRKYQNDPRTIERSKNMAKNLWPSL